MGTTVGSKTFTDQDYADSIVCIVLIGECLAADSGAHGPCTF